MIYFQPPEVVDCGSETVAQVVENLNKLTISNFQPLMVASRYRDPQP